MIATAFNEENTVLDPPPSMSLEECSVLSVFRGVNNEGQSVVISCWKPTADEWEEMKRTGRIWIIVYGETMPPVAISGKTPFIEV